MDWMDLKSFVTIVREKSISKASLVLHLSQSALTMRLKKFEQELGIDLLERNWKGIALTKGGEAILYYATKALSEMNAMKKIADEIVMQKSATSLYEANPNHLKIGIAEPLGWTMFQPILQKLHDQDIIMKYDLLCEHYMVILDLVSLGDVQVGIVPYFDNRPDLQCIPIYKDELLLLGPKNEDLLNFDDPESMQTLLKKPFFMTHSSKPIRKLNDEILLRLLGQIPSDTREVNDFNVLQKLVSNGLGYTVLPSSLMYETISFYRSIHASNQLPDKLSHDSVPFEIYRLGSVYPSRIIHMVYSPSTKYLEAIHQIADQITYLFKGSAENP